MFPPTIAPHRRFNRAAQLWLATRDRCHVLAAGGCSNMASQAANVEGVRLYQQGNYQQASDRFQQAIAQDPASPEGYYNLAASLQKTGTLYNRPADLQQAEVLYNQCLERDPNHAERPSRPGGAAERNESPAGSLPPAQQLGRGQSDSRPSRRSSSRGCSKKPARPSKPRRSSSKR